MPFKKQKDRWVLLKCFEEEAEEDVGEEQDEREDDGASQATQGTHAFILFLLGFLFTRVFLFGGRSLSSSITAIS